MEHQLTTFDRPQAPSSLGVTDPSEGINHGPTVDGETPSSVELELWKTKQRLIRSERLASLGEMTAAILHEIRNPLTVILGYLDLELAEFPDNGRINIMKKQAEQMSVLARSVLRYAGVQTENSGYLNLNDVVHGLRDLIGPVARNVEIQIELGANLPPVVADAGQIEQVLMNLVLNAIDAMERGSGRLIISTGHGSVAQAIEEAGSAGHDYSLALEMSRHEMQGEFAYFEVEDNAVGIPPENLSRLFEAFYTTKNGESGTGLGLYIARTIVGNWGGNILVSSKFGAGTKFRILLPEEG